MQASAFSIKAKSIFPLHDRSFLSSAGASDFRKNSLAVVSGDDFRTTNKAIFSRISVGSGSMGGRGSVQSLVGSSAKTRPLRAHASENVLEDLKPAETQEKTSENVLPYVGVACLGALLFGYHLGVVNGALEYLSKDLGIAENTVLQGWVVSALLAGATVGSFTGGSLADKFGRTKTFVLDAIPLAVGTFLCAISKSVETMIIGRVLAGFGIGISSAIVPLYISEISPTEIHGILGSVNQLFICIGILVALVAGLPLAGNPSWWRTMFSIALVPSILLAVGMAFSPESPRWLYQQGKIAEAEVSIRRLFGKEKVAEVMGNLDAAGQGSSEPEAGWFDLFSGRYRKGTDAGIEIRGGELDQLHEPFQLYVRACQKQSLYPLQSLLS